MILHFSRGSDLQWALQKDMSALSGRQFQSWFLHWDIDPLRKHHIKGNKSFSSAIYSQWVSSLTVLRMYRVGTWKLLLLKWYDRLIFPHLTIFVRETLLLVPNSWFWGRAHECFLCAQNVSLLKTNTLCPLSFLQLKTKATGFLLCNNQARLLKNWHHEMDLTLQCPAHLSVSDHPKWALVQLISIPTVLKACWKRLIPLVF